jgi:hypothetical protein
MERLWQRVIPISPVPDQDRHGKKCVNFVSLPFAVFIPLHYNMTAIH